MKIATVTLNPAIDQTVSVENFQAGAVNRSRAMRFDAGGKGVNVASFLADYGLAVVVTGFLGEENASLFERHFARKKIEDCFIRVPGETRVNIKITDEHNQETTDLNTPGQAPGSYAMDRLVQQLETLSETCDWIVLSGNLPPGIAVDVYAQLIEIGKRRGRHVVLDTSGEALHAGIQAGPQIIKPNISELSQVTGRELKELNEVQAAATSLLSDKLQLVVVSMGADGALFLKKSESILAMPPQVSLKSTVGAGDAMVAGLVAGLTSDLPLAECAKLATAFSMCAITQLERDLPSSTQLEAYQRQVTVTPLETQQT